MPLFSRTFTVALAAVAVAAAGLLLFSRVVVPALDGPVGTGGIDHAPSTVKSKVAPLPVPTAVRPAASDNPAPSHPAPGQSFRDMENARALEQRDPQAAGAIRSLAWVADGVGEEEREAAEALIYLAATSDGVFDALLRKPWLNNGDFRAAGRAVVDLEYLAYRDEGAARLLLDMPFLESLQPADALAVEALANIAYRHLPTFKRVVGHPSISDGITDEEARVVAVLDSEYLADASLVDTLLDPAAVSVEERAVTVPLAGEMTLAIVRTGPGAARSMDLLEEAVIGVEALVGEPFPARYVPLLFTDAVPASLGGSHNGSHLAVLPDFDVDDGSYEALQAGRVIAHEVAHYYWRWSQPWLDEGAAEFTAAFLEHQRSGSPLEPVNYPCGPSETIGSLEGRSIYATDLAYVCNYAVGERFFLDLYNRLGAEAFWPGYRSLYRDTVQAGREAAVLPGIDNVRRAFGGPAGEGSAARGQVVEDVIGRWGEGLAAGELNGPDGRPVVAELPEVFGWVNRAYVSLEEEGRPVKAFAAGDAGDWAWLTLEYSHDYAGPPTELTFEVVEYYEDGFPYRRDTLTIEAHRRYSGGVQWLSIGPGPGQNWATGRHWVYVNHEGRKVAQVEFEVNP